MVEVTNKHLFRQLDQLQKNSI